MKNKMIDNSALGKIKAAITKDLNKYFDKQMKIISKAKTLPYLEDECHFYVSDRTFAMIDKAIEKENA